MLKFLDVDIDAPTVPVESEAKLKYTDFINKNLLPEFKFTPEHVDEIADVFCRFQGNLIEGIGEERIENKYVKVFLRALDLDPTPVEFRNLIEEIDVDNTGSISLYKFGELLQKVMTQKNSKIELLRAYRLFDIDSKGYISIEDMKRASEAAGENMSSAELEELICAADLKNTGVVMKKDFFNFMKVVHFGLDEL